MQPRVMLNALGLEIIVAFLTAGILILTIFRAICIVMFKAELKHSNAFAYTALCLCIAKIFAEISLISLRMFLEWGVARFCADLFSVILLAGMHLLLNICETSWMKYTER